MTKSMPTIAVRAIGRDNNFDLIRLLAACSVLVSHAYPISLGDGTAEPLASLLRGKTLGGISVAAFFAISGFFITQSFDRRASFAGFAAARFLRLFPALAMALALTIALGAALTHSPHNEYWPAAISYFFRNLTLFHLQYQLPGVFITNPYGPAINGSLWTLSYEVVCYSGVVIFGAFGTIKNPRLFCAGLACFLVFYAATRVFNMHPRSETFASLAFPFIAGMSFYVWRSRIPLSAGLAAALWTVVAFAWTTPFFTPALMIALSYSIFVIGFWNASLLLRLRNISDYSYGTYVYAFPVQQLVAYGGVREPLLNIAISLPATLILAMLSWHLLERPALALRHRHGKRTPPVPQS